MAYFHHDIDFGQTVTRITKVECTTECIANYPSGEPGHLGVRYMRIYLWYSGQWNLVYEPINIPDWFAPYAKITHSLEGNWFNVSKIRLTRYTGESVYPPHMDGDVEYRTFELKAWGNNYVDIGLRYSKGGATYRIGAEAVDSSHKLRIYKGATVYGLPLIPISDPVATPIRINDGISVKALVKLT